MTRTRQLTEEKQGLQARYRHFDTVSRFWNAAVLKHCSSKHPGHVTMTWCTSPQFQQVCTCCLQVVGGTRINILLWIRVICNYWIGFDTATSIFAHTCVKENSTPFLIIFFAVDIYTVKIKAHPLIIDIFFLTIFMKNLFFFLPFYIPTDASGVDIS